MRPNRQERYLQYSMSYLSHSIFSFNRTLTGHFFLHPFLNGHESWPGICLVLLGTKGAIPVFSCGPSRLVVRSHTGSVTFRLANQNEQTDSDLRILTAFRRCSSFQELCSEEDCIQRTCAALFASFSSLSLFAYLCNAGRWSARLLWSQW